MAKLEQKRPWYIRNVWSDYQETNIIFLALEFLVLTGIIAFVMYGFCGFVYIFKLV